MTDNAQAFLDRRSTLVDVIRHVGEHVAPTLAPVDTLPERNLTRHCSETGGPEPTSCRPDVQGVLIVTLGPSQSAHNSVPDAILPVRQGQHHPDPSPRQDQDWAIWRHARRGGQRRGGAAHRRVWHRSWEGPTAQMVGRSACRGNVIRADGLGWTSVMKSRRY